MTSASDLRIKGEYRIKNNVKIKVCKTPLTYMGTNEYQGKTYYTFYDPIMGLMHWINPDDVEPVQAATLLMRQ